MRWGCYHCSQVKKWRLIQRFEKRKGGFRYRMVTLTEWKHHDNFENAKELTKHFHRLQNSLKKHGVYLDHFFWAKEYKKRSCEFCKEDCPNAGYKMGCIVYPLLYPHIHILIPLTIDTALISRLWFLATGRTADNIHIGDDNEVNILKNPAAYMTKYLTKSDMQTGFSERERRYGFSRDMPPWDGTSKVIIDGVEYIYTPYVKVKGVIFKLGNPDLEFREGYDEMIHHKIKIPPDIDNSIFICKPIPQFDKNKRVMWKKYLFEFIDYYSKHDYLQVDKGGETYRYILESVEKTCAIKIFEHTVTWAVAEHNKKFAGSK